MSSEDRINPESGGHAMAIGRVYVERDPLYVLKELRAQMAWSSRDGWFIPLGESGYKRLIECIAFHTGGDTIIAKDGS
jgi:hypothetical protein